VEDELTLTFLDRLQPLGLLVLRVVLGVIMIAHGYRNLFGGGLHQHAKFVASLGIPTWLGYVSSIAEFGGGILLVVGLFTRIAALAVCIDLLVAIFKVHFHNGLMGQGGYEYPLALAAMAFALIFTSGGSVSLDWVVGGSGPVHRR
jgi:putative oxidoreductase